MNEQNKPFINHAKRGNTKEGAEISRIFEDRGAGWIDRFDFPAGNWEELGVDLTPQDHWLAREALFIECSKT
jgi:hypothetical protein